MRAAPPRACSTAPTSPSSALRRRHVGFVFQFFHLLPELGGEANVLLAGRVRGAHPDAAMRGRDLVDRLGLRPVAASLPSQLSGGEQQRFAIARALVNDPAVLLADEPTGNLDLEAGAEVLRLLRAGADEGRALVMVTHDAAATQIADRVLRLDGGRLVASRAPPASSPSWTARAAARRGCAEGAQTATSASTSRRAGSVPSMPLRGRAVLGAFFLAAGAIHYPRPTSRC